MDIITGEILSSIYVVIYNVIYWSVCSFSKRGGDNMTGESMSLIWVDLSLSYIGQ